MQSTRPRPDNFPVGSMSTPSGRRTKRTIERFGRMVRQPTQVRWGICLGRFTVLPVTLLYPCSRRSKTACYYIVIPILPRNHHRHAYVSYGQRPRHDFHQIPVHGLSWSFYPSSSPVFAGIFRRGRGCENILKREDFLEFLLVGLTFVFASAAGAVSTVSSASGVTASGAWASVGISAGFQPELPLVFLQTGASTTASGSAAVTFGQRFFYRLHGFRSNSGKAENTIGIQLHRHHQIAKVRCSASVKMV